MGNTFVVTRVQIAYALCLPLAVLIGYFLADPTDLSTMVIIGLVFAVLSIPILMRWYHPLLILAWNAAIQPFFLPGQFFLWTILGFLGFGFAMLNRFTSLDARLVNVPAVSRSLLFIAATVILTAWFRGGLGFRGLGASSYGGKSYIWLLGAIAGYFALVSARIPLKRAGLFACLFFLSGITSLIPNVAWILGGSADVLFYVFPPAYAMEQARGDFMVNAGIVRIAGLMLASNALLAGLLVRFGIRGVFDFWKPWRFCLFGLALLGSLYCGFRNVFILSLLILGIQFCLEGLYRGRVLIGTLSVGIVALCILAPNADRLPIVAQRTLSFLPFLNVSPDARVAGQASTDWRLQIWKEALPEVPKFLFLGKGHSIDPSLLALSTENEHRGYVTYSEQALVVGNYHNGPLSVIIPFGIWGVIGFGWFVVASLRYLYRSYRYGLPELHNINTFLLTFFIARLVIFLFVFGAFAEELVFFTGVIGLSVSLNGADVRKPDSATEMESEEMAFNEHFASQELEPSLTPSLTKPS